MPVGCVHHFIVVKRSAVMRVLKKSIEANDQERVKFARLMLSSLHSDQYLIAIEDMGGTDCDIENLKHLGLEGHDGKYWQDYYAPHITNLPAPWLLFAPIRETGLDGTYGHVIWCGYKHIQDQSAVVNVWEGEGYPAKPRESFPSTAQAVW